MKGGWLVPFARYSEFWRHSRKLLDPGFKPGALMVYHPMIQMKTRTLLTWLLASPGEWEAHIERFVACSFFQVTSVPNHLLKSQTARRAGPGHNVWLPGQREPRQETLCGQRDDQFFRYIVPSRCSSCQ